MFTLLLGCSSDSSTDPICTQITCLNGGTATVNCGCNCPTGYTGTNCGTQAMPTKILINKIKVIKFPNTRPNGTAWDSSALPPFDKPDIFPVLFNSSNVVLFAGFPRQDVASTGNDNFSFFPSVPIEITTPTASFSLGLYDEDTSTTQETMGGFFNVFIYSSTGGFPSTITVGSTADIVRFELELSYVW